MTFTTITDFDLLNALIFFWLEMIIGGGWLVCGSICLTWNKKFCMRDKITKYQEVHNNLQAKRV